MSVDDLLSNFAQAPTAANDTEECTNIIQEIAQSGEAGAYNWNHLKHLIAYRLDKLVTEFEEGAKDFAASEVQHQNFAKQKEQLVQLLLGFSAAPFTLQRLCELLLDASRFYKRTPKLLRGLEKLVLVNTTQPVSHALGRMSVSFVNGVFQATLSAPSQPAVDQGTAAQQPALESAPASDATQSTGAPTDEQVADTTQPEAVPMQTD
ncbi:hypothetical protein CAOG_02411 [Capsaspora owczarzaki ATCC 30864]|uniref:hypothetical protein n=1 Tax=Capsaspora owczarzaki (strain ATCC 30864) TaxID=595528 RepID=UPI0001FE4EC0|nr:hypothetical protein CAOG_02411 [Capsaspora owczarzaki ATCC 30864]|eukprot:XP_004349161.1 hypothetical protein CAOG_02411 [Capsaspora owczarzaki ATCC 30864]